MKERKQPPDWEAIEQEYRAGQVSIREIARKFGVTDGAVRKKAKAENWQRALADKVRQGVRERLVRTDGTQGGTHSERVSDEVIAERAIEIGQRVVLTHRGDLQQLRAIGATLATRLAAILNGEPIDGPCLGAKESPGDLFEKLARVKSRLIPLERQAFNLDANAQDDNEAATLVGAANGLARKLARLAPCEEA